MTVKTKPIFLIMAFTVSLVLAQSSLHDVGITGIIEPVGKIIEGVTVTPRVAVENFGTATETFSVAFTFKGYSDVEEVFDLDPGNQTIVTFNDWTAGETAKYTTTASIQIGFDENASNDVMKDSFQVVNKLHDIGVTAISAPAGKITQGTKITPKAMVKNLGTEPESFNVNFSFPGYSSTKKVANLMPGASQEVNFDSWTATAPADFTAWATAQLLREENKVNNSMKATFKVIKPKHDVGVTAILNPIGEITENSVTIPSARVKNFGTETESFTVTFEFSGYSSAKKVTRLEPGKTATLDFDKWTPKDLNHYTTKVTTNLGGDEDKTNNTLKSSFNVTLPY
jgi:CARDB